MGFVDLPNRQSLLNTQTVSLHTSILVGHDLCLIVASSVCNRTVRITESDTDGMTLIWLVANGLLYRSHLECIVVVKYKFSIKKW